MGYATVLAPTPNPPQGVDYTPQPTAGKVYDTTDYSSLWNTAWNQGYNNSGNSSNPYSGQSGNGYDIGSAYTQGQQQYLKDKQSNTPKNDTFVNTNNNNSTQPSGSYNFNINDFSNYAGWDPTAAYQDWKAKGSPAPGSSGGSGGDPNAAVRNQLNSAWDSYFKNLDDQYNGLVGQSENMNQIANNSYNQSINDIEASRADNQLGLDTESRKNSENQVKALTDIADNIRNLFRSGNVYLGTRGAGDSSAANQYSYAVTKVGSKQRGDVVNQTRAIDAEIGDRQARLNKLVMYEKSKIKTDLDNKILETAQWLASAQNELKSARANGELQKGQSLAQLSQDILNTANQRLSLLEQSARERNNALDTWAMNNSTNVGQLKTNLASVAAYKTATPTYNNYSGTPTVDSSGNVRTYWSTAGKDDEKTY